MQYGLLIVPKNIVYFKLEPCCSDNKNFIVLIKYLRIAAELCP